MRRKGVRVTLLVLIALVGAALGAGWYFGVLFNKPTVQGATQVNLPATAVRTLATGLQSPWGLAFLPDGTALITERDTARILSIRMAGTGSAGAGSGAGSAGAGGAAGSASGTDGVGEVTEIGRIAEAEPDGEGGLLGIAVSPTFGVDRAIFIYYSTQRDNRVARLKLGPDGTVSGAPTVIFSDIPRSSNHNGGRIAFGPDGMLYVGTGDAGDRVRAQNKDRLNGKILRLTPAGKPAPGNPFGDDSPVYSYGHRNVQGLAWDASGRLFATEFGQNRYDELNLIEAGHNYGWPQAEGASKDKQMTNPIATWATSDASPSGLAIVGDTAYLACLRGKKLYRIGLDGSHPETLLVNTYGRLRAVVAAPDGSLWVLTSNRDGRGTPAATDDRILRLALP